MGIDRITVFGYDIETANEFVWNNIVCRNNGRIVKLIKKNNKFSVTLVDGTEINIVAPVSARATHGHRFDKAYVDWRIPSRFVELIIKPYLSNGDYDLNIITFYDNHGF